MVTRDAFFVFMEVGLPGEMAQWGKCLLYKHMTSVRTLMTHIKARCSAMHMEPMLGGEDRHIPRTCWQDSLVEMADTRFSKKDHISKTKVER